MKFGVLQFFSWSRRVPLETVYQRAFERIAIMDEGGYDAVWLVEVSVRRLSPLRMSIRRSGA